MAKKAGAGAQSEAAESKSEAHPESKDSGTHDITGSFAVFESLEALRQAPLEPELPSAESRQEGEESNLQDVLNRYSDWLRTLDN